MRRFPVMVFAAGFGTRMGALTRDRPKPLIEVAGRCLLDQALDLTTGAGLDRRVVNLHYHGDQIARHLAGPGHSTQLGTGRDSGHRGWFARGPAAAGRKPGLHAEL